MAAIIAAVPGMAAQFTASGLSLAMAVVFWHCQPFYREAVNAFYIATFSLTTYLGLLSAFAVHGSNGVLAQVAAWGGPIAALVGYGVAQWRWIRCCPVAEIDFSDLALDPLDGVVKALGTRGSSAKSDSHLSLKVHPMHRPGPACEMAVPPVCPLCPTLAGGGALSALSPPYGPGMPSHRPVASLCAQVRPLKAQYPGP